MGETEKKEREVEAEVGGRKEGGLGGLRTFLGSPSHAWSVAWRVKSFPNPETFSPHSPGRSAPPFRIAGRLQDGGLRSGWAFGALACPRSSGVRVSEDTVTPRTE